ncbi:MAG: adenosylmethionine--8-amino-7-oxononanoate transaminase [Bacteroidota bacterium]
MGRDILKQDKKLVWHPFTPLQGVADNLVVTSAEGSYLITEDGRKILDGVSSWWVNLHGHSHPLISKAIAEQSAKLEHVIFAGFTHEPAVELAKNLLSILPDNQKKVFYSDNGSTAVEVGIKMAIQYWYNKKSNRKKIIAIDGAYHGDTFGAMSVGERSIFTSPFTNYLFQVEFVDFPFPEKEKTVFEHFCTMIDSEEISAFIFEPLIQGASGMRMYSAKMLDKMIGYAQSKDVICIADEVMTGFGRTGSLFASDHLNHKPDVICLSKGITGGALPLGATSCNQRIVEAFQSNDLKEAFLHGHSYTANPMACAAANASFDLLTSENCIESIKRISDQHDSFRKRLKHPRVKDVRCKGVVLAVEFETDEDSSYLSELRNRIYPFFLERNILLRPLGNLIYVLPPYVITNEELGSIYKAIEEFLDTIET